MNLPVMLWLRWLVLASTASLGLASLSNAVTPQIDYYRVAGQGFTPTAALLFGLAVGATLGARDAGAPATYREFWRTAGRLIAGILTVAAAAALAGVATGKFCRAWWATGQTLPRTWFCLGWEWGLVIGTLAAVTFVLRASGSPHKNTR